MVSNFAGQGPSGSGNTDGSGTNAQFNQARGLAISGTNLYVADSSNNAVRVVNTETKEVTTLAGGTSGIDDGTGTNAQFRSPYGLAIFGTKLYVVDRGNDAIRVVDTETTEVTTLAGVKFSSGSDDGTGTNARFDNPEALALSISGTNLYVADGSNHAIRVVNTVTKEVTTLAGGSGDDDGSEDGTTDGTGTNALFNYPWGLAISGTNLYVADRYNTAIRVVNTETKEVTTLAGGIFGIDDGTGTNAQFRFPLGLSISCNKLYVADIGNYAIRVVDTDTKEVTTVAGEKGTQGTTGGTGTNAQFWNLRSLQLDPAGDASTFYVTDAHAIRLVKFE